MSIYCATNNSNICQTYIKQCNYFYLNNKNTTENIKHYFNYNKKKLKNLISTINDYTKLLNDHFNAVMNNNINLDNEDDDFGFLVKYEQNTFWESYQGGYPISESVYAPGVELFFRPNPDLKIVIGYESRTNGGDGDYLRKMNFARLSLYRYFPLRDESFFSMGFQTYLGAGFVGENRSLENLYLYKGYFTAGAWYQTPDSNFKIRVTATPYDHLRRCGVEVNMYYRPYYSILDNVYFMIQYGYGLEQMQQYLPAGNDLLPQHYIRFGISFCPEFTL